MKISDKPDPLLFKAQSPVLFMIAFGGVTKREIEQSTLPIGYYPFISEQGVANRVNKDTSMSLELSLENFV